MSTIERVLMVAIAFMGSAAVGLAMVAIAVLANG